MVRRFLGRHLGALEPGRILSGAACLDLSVRLFAFPSPWCLPIPGSPLLPRVFLGGCAGHLEAGRKPGAWCLPRAPRDAGAGLVPRYTLSGPAVGLSLVGPSSIGLGLRALRLFRMCGSGPAHVQFPVPSALRLGCRSVHRGCCMRRSATPRGGWGGATPGSPAYLCVGLCLPRLGGPTSRARFGVPHLSFGRSCLPFFFLNPLRVGLAPLVMFLFHSLPVGFGSGAPGLAPPLVLAFFCFRSHVPRALAPCL